MEATGNVRALDRRAAMRLSSRLGRASAAWGLVVPGTAVAQSACTEDTLDKIKRTGVFALGARQSTPPYGYLDAQNNWVGFATEIARVIHGNLEKEIKVTV